MNLILFKSSLSLLLLLHSKSKCFGLDFEFNDGEVDEEIDDVEEDDRVEQSKWGINLNSFEFDLQKFGLINFWLVKWVIKVLDFDSKLWLVG